MNFDRNLYILKFAHKQLDKAHRAACEALATFDAIHDDRRFDGETRLAAKSLRAETLEFCGHIRAAMNAVPEAALPRREAPPAVVEQDWYDGTGIQPSNVVRQPGIVSLSTRLGYPVI